MLFVTRREVSLLLFALSVFLIAYNLNSTPSLSSLSSSSSASLNLLADLSANALLRARNSNILRKDGRRAKQYADALETDVLGDWEINTRKSHDLSPYGVTEEAQHVFWEGGDVPRSTLVAHVPGTSPRSYFGISAGLIDLRGTL